MNKIFSRIVILLLGILIPFFNIVPTSAAVSEFSVSPMKQKIILLPGETYQGSFEVINPSSNTDELHYVLDVRPFYVDDSNTVVFKNNGDYSQIVDWIVLDSESGSVLPNSTKTIYFTINVPNDAPAGGQYASIVTTLDNGATDSEGAMNIQNVLAIAHTVYAEVAGNTIRSGEVYDLNLPSVLLSGDITASSSVKNTGNVHGVAKYSLQVYPLFSNEEVYTTEENPQEKTVLPDRTLYSETTWADTPSVGIYNVVYTVEFEGITQQISKMVIICPIWLLFIIIFAVIALIIWIVLRTKNRRGGRARTDI